MGDGILAGVAGVQSNTKAQKSAKPSKEEIIANVTAQLDQARKEDPIFGSLFSMPREELVQLLEDKGKEFFLGYKYDDKGELVAPKNALEFVKNFFAIRLKMGFKTGINQLTSFDVDKVAKARNFKDFIEASDVVSFAESAKKSVDGKQYKAAALCAAGALVSVPGSPLKAGGGLAKKAIGTAAKTVGREAASEAVGLTVRRVAREAESVNSAVRILADSRARSSAAEYEKRLAARAARTAYVGSSPVKQAGARITSDAYDAYRTLREEGRYGSTATERACGMIDAKNATTARDAAEQFKRAYASQPNAEIVRRANVALGDARDMQQLTSRVGSVCQTALRSKGATDELRRSLMPDVVEMLRIAVRSSR